MFCFIWSCYDHAIWSIFPWHAHAQHFFSAWSCSTWSDLVFGWSGHWWCGGRKVKSSCTINKARDASVKATNALTTGDKSGYLLVDWWKREGHYCTGYNKWNGAQCHCQLQVYIIIKILSGKYLGILIFVLTRNVHSSTYNWRNPIRKEKIKRMWHMACQSCLDISLSNWLVC